MLKSRPVSGRDGPVMLASDKEDQPCSTIPETPRGADCAAG